MSGLRNGALSDRQKIALSSRQLAIAIAQAALDVKAEEVVILDLRKLSFSFDFFVICSGSSDRRLRTIAENVQEEFSKRGLSIDHVEGLRDGGWILLDCGPVVSHIFSPEMREFYNLQRLWADAPRLSVPKKRLSTAHQQ